MNASYRIVFAGPDNVWHTTPPLSKDTAVAKRRVMLGFGLRAEIRDADMVALETPEVVL